MKTYYQSDQLQSQIDWENIMKMSRYAGGHDDQMMGLFKNSTVIGHYNEGNWQGTVATCVLLEDGEYVIYNDYYGSCSGCDSWEGATDESVRNMCIGLSNDSYIFSTIGDVVNFLKWENKEKYSWSTEVSLGLLLEIMKNLSTIREIKIDSILNS